MHVEQEPGAKPVHEELGRGLWLKPAGSGEFCPRRFHRPEVEPERVGNPRCLARAAGHARPRAVVHAAEQVGEGNRQHRGTCAVGKKPEYASRDRDPASVILD